MCFYELISALLTAQNIPLIDWSKTTFNNVLLQRVKMYLQVLNDGFVVLEPASGVVRLFILGGTWGTEKARDL